jgi:hypothetical protein
MATEKEIEVVGKPPNKDDKFWIDIASKITPDKSVERLDTHGKYLFSTVSIVGTLLTGFGIFSPMGATVLRNPLIFLPVGLACLSLALAMMGITPMVHKLYLQDINSVRNYYNHLIRERGRFIFWGSVVFSLSLLSVALVTAASLKPAPLTPAISVRLMGTGEKTILTAKIELQELPRSGTAETQIVGYEDTKKGPQQSILFKETTRADQAGKMTVSAELDKLGKYKWFMITHKVMSGTEILCEKKVEVRR